MDMIKINLDYLQKRGEAFKKPINEMARQSEWDRMSQTSPDIANFNTLYKQTVQNIQKIGKIPTASAREKALTYMISLLGGSDVAGGTSGVTDLTWRYTRKPKTKENTPEFSKWIGDKSQSFQKRKEFTLIQLVKNNIKKATSKKFASTVLDPENIQNFVKTGRVPEGSGFARGMAKQTEDIFNMPVEKIHELRAEIYPTLIKLNRLQSGRNRSRKGGKVSDINDPVNVAKTVKSTLEDLLDSKQDIMNRIKQGSQPTDDESIILSKFPEKDLISLINTFTKLANGKGITMEDVYSKVIQPYQNNQNQVIAGFGDLLDLSIESFTEVSGEEEKQDFPPYDNDIVYGLLEKGDITDEDLKNLKAWLPIASKYKELEDMKGISKDVRGASGDYLSGKVDMGGGGEEEEEDEEDSIMGYMTEQIQKDSLYNPKGEFKERGFKKFQNYNHWLTHNQ